MTSQAEFVPPKNIKIKPPLVQIRPLHHREESAEATLAKLNDLVNCIHTKIKSVNQKKMQSDVQSELSDLLLLPSRIGKCILEFEADYNSLWSRFLGVLPGTSRKDKIAEISLLIPSLEIAIDALFQESPNIILARKIRKNIEKNLRKHEIESPILLFLVNFVKDTLNSPSTPLKVSVGLLLSLPLYGAFMLIAGAIFVGTSSLISKEEAVSSTSALNTTTIVGEVRSPSPETSPGENQSSISNPQPTTKNDGVIPTSAPSMPRVSTNVLEKTGVDVINLQENLLQVILVVSAGTLGSIVSILTRIREFRNENYRDSSLPIFVGLFKPIIGASFGVLMFALINSDLISISTLEGNQRKDERAFFFYSLAFVVGFSERLANDIVSRTENMFSSSSTSVPTLETVLMQQLNRKDLPPEVVQDLTTMLLQISTKRDDSPPPASDASLLGPTSSPDLDPDASPKTA